MVKSKTEFESLHIPALRDLLSTCDKVGLSSDQTKQFIMQFFVYMHASMDKEHPCYPVTFSWNEFELNVDQSKLLSDVFMVMQKKLSLIEPEFQDLFDVRLFKPFQVKDFATVARSLHLVMRGYLPFMMKIGFRLFASMAKDVLYFIRQKEGRQNDHMDHPVLAKIMLEMLGIDEHRDYELYDPFAGYGNVLNEAYAMNGNRESLLFGQEISKHAWQINAMLSLLNGYRSSRTKCGDVISEPKWLGNRRELRTFDRVATVLPAFEPSWLSDRSNREIIFEDKYYRFSDIDKTDLSIYKLAVRHIMRSLKENGKAVVAFPERWLKQADGTLGTFWRGVFESDSVKTIVKLPKLSDSALGEYTYLVMFEKRQKGSFAAFEAMSFMTMTQDPSIWMIDYTRVKRKSGFDHIEMEQLLETIHKPYDFSDLVSKVSTDQLLEKQFSLDPGDYVRKQVNEFIDLGKFEFDEARFLDRVKFVALADVALVLRGMNVANSELNEYRNEYRGYDDDDRDSEEYQDFSDNLELSHAIVQLSDVNKVGKLDVSGISRRRVSVAHLPPARLKQYELEAGDAIISSRGSTVKCSVITPEMIDEMIKKNLTLLASSNFIKVRFKDEQLNIRMTKAQFFKYYVTTDVGKYYVRRLMRGTTLLTLSYKDLEKFMLPDVDIQIQERLVNTFTTVQEKYYSSRETLDRQFDDDRLRVFGLLSVGGDIIRKKSTNDF